MEVYAEFGQATSSYEEAKVELEAVQRWVNPKPSSNCEYNTYKSSQR